MKKMIYTLVLSFISSLFIIFLASCENNDEKIIKENLQFREIGIDDTESNHESNLVSIYHNYRTGNYPIIKYVNTGNKINSEIYPGLGSRTLREIEWDKENNAAEVDLNQVLNLKIQRKVEWFSTGYVSNEKKKDPIITEIYEGKNNLGYFMSDDFSKVKKNVKCEDEVTKEELFKNYFESSKRGETHSYCWIFYLYYLECEENDFFKYLKKELEYDVDGKVKGEKIVNPFINSKDYTQVNKILLGGIIIQLEIINDEIVTYWTKDGVKYYY